MSVALVIFIAEWGALLFLGINMLQLLDCIFEFIKLYKPFFSPKVLRHHFSFSQTVKYLFLHWTRHLLCWIVDGKLDLHALWSMHNEWMTVRMKGFELHELKDRMGLFKKKKKRKSALHLLIMDKRDGQKGWYTTEVKQGTL